MTDEAFFALLDPARPELARVRAAVEQQDWAGAKAAFAAHLRSRAMPRWYFDWRAREAPQAQAIEVDMQRADRFVRNELVSCDIWHDFGADIDWTYNAAPPTLREWTWQLSRQGYWRDLGRAYWKTGDEKYARAFVAQMRDWVMDNPVPEGKAEQGTGSRWRTIEAGIRMGQSWPDAFFRFLGSPSFDDESLAMMVKSFVEHARYLLAHPTGGNWLMMESNGLYHVGALFPEFSEAAGWRDAAIQRLYEELDNQVYPDGVQNELSTAYHQATLKNAEWALRLARLNEYSLPTDYLQRMERMCDVNLYLAKPDWRLPDLNDGTALDIRRYMAEAAELFPQRADYRFAATAGAEGSPPAITSTAFPYAGFLVMRSGWDRDARWGLMEVGPFGAGHQHEDKLNFILFAYGRYMLVDPGNYQYDPASPWRQYVFRSYAHNVIHIDGMEQYRRGQQRNYYVVKEPVEHVWQTTPAFDYAKGTYGNRGEDRYGGEYRLPAMWHRHVLFVKHGGSATAPASQTAGAGDYWLVVDELDPLDLNPHLYESMFHLDLEQVTLQPEDHRLISTDADVANLSIIPAANPLLRAQIVRGQESPVVQGWMPAEGYAVRPIPTLIYSLETSGRVVLAYVFYPLPPGGACPVQVVEAVSTEGAQMQYRLRFTDGRHDLLTVGAEPSVRQGP